MTARCLRVLLAEKRLSETGSILRSLCAEAGWALELIFVATRSALRAALQAHCSDVALLDLALLQPGAASYLRVLHLANGKVPFLLLSEVADKACAVECLSMGARDFLLERFMDERTVARVLRSAAGASEEQTSMTTTEPKTGGPECAFSDDLEVIEEVQLHGEDTKGMRRELVQVVNRNVRASEQIVPRWGARIDLVLGDANECRTQVLMRRLRARTNADKRSQISVRFSQVSVRAEGISMMSQPLVSKASGFATEDLKYARKFLARIEARG